MIEHYNRSQTLKAVFAMLIGLVAVVLTFVLIHFAVSMASKGFGLGLSSGLSQFIAVVGVCLVGFSGYRTWKTKGGLHSYHESAFYHDLGEGSGGAVMVDFYAHRVTAPAHLLNQLFLSGPLRLLEAWTLFKSRLPNDPDLESQLQKALATLKVANKWQSLSDYPSQRNEILHLAQIGLVDFSAHKGEPRIKAR